MGEPSSGVDHQGAGVSDWLVGGGELAARIRSTDWSKTPLGPRESWVPALRTALNLVLAHRFPMALLWGPEYRLLYNDAFKDLVHFDPPEALGLPAREAFPRAWATFGPQLASLSASGEPLVQQELILPFPRPQGIVEVAFDLCLSPVHVEDGTVGGVLATLHDAMPLVAKRRSAEEALRRNVALLQAISDASTDLLYAKDRAGRYLFINPAALALVGRPAEAVLGRTDAEIVSSPEAARRMTENDRVVLESGATREFEEQVPLPDGKVRVWQSKKTPFRDASGEIVGLLGISRNVTERLAAERALKVSEERLRSLFRQAAVGIGRIGLDGRFLEVNQRFAEILGRTVEALATLTTYELTWPDDLQADRECARGLLAGEIQSCTVVKRYLRPDGSLVWTDLTASLGHDGEGRPDSFIVVLQDATDRRRAEEALRESERFNRNLIENSRDCIKTLDLTGHLLSMNDGGRRLLGIEDLGPLLGRSWVELWAEESRPKAREAVEQAARGGTGRFQALFPSADGTPRWWDVLITPIAGPTGAVERLLASSREITELKQAEEALRASEQRVRGLLEASPIGAAIGDVSGRVVFANDAALRTVGITREEFERSEPRWDLVTPPEHLEKDRRAIQQALQRGHSDLYEKEYLRADGTRVPVTLAVAALGGGEVAAFSLDLTERKRMEDALRESERRYRIMGETLPYGVWLCNARGGAEYVSQSFLDLLEMTPEQMREFGWTHRLPPEDVQPMLARWLHCVETGEPWDSEHRVLGPDGKYHHVLTRGLPVRDESGKITCWVGINLDIDKRYEMEERLREADRRKTEFLALLSHELRNPLAPITLSLHLLKVAPAGGPQAQRALAVVERQVAHLTRLVDDLLDVTRISRGKISLRRETVDLGELIRRVGEDHRDLFESSGVELAIGPAPAFVQVRGDPTRLAQIVGNLLANAAKFTPSGGRVSLSLAARGEFAEVEVLDDGEGVSAELLGRLFEPFVQAPQPLARGRGGLGLGLALVRGLAELHGGEASVSSAGEGAGARFTVRLPLEAPVAEAAGAPARAPAGPAARRVLIIEDNEDAASTLKEVLELSGHVVELAGEGDEGIRKARAVRPEVILCDLGLPGMDGLQVARELRADPELKRVELVALSGYAGPEDIERTRAAGFDRHLAKPVDFAQLDEVLASVGNRGQPPLPRSGKRGCGGEGGPGSPEDPSPS